MAPGFLRRRGVGPAFKAKLKPSARKWAGHGEEDSAALRPMPQTQAAPGLVPIRPAWVPEGA